jgi:hypothetical protein
MGSGFSIIDSNFRNAFDRRGGIDGAVVVQETAMTVIGVLAQTDVTGDIDAWE